LPEYHFAVRYKRAEKKVSDVLQIKGWIKSTLKSKDDQKILTDAEYILYLLDGSKIDGRTNERGEIFQGNLLIGNRILIVSGDE
jgi:hypothetical protein